MATISVPPAVTNAFTEGVLVFATTEAAGFGANALGIISYFPSWAFTGAAVIAGLIAGIRDYQQSP